MEDPYTKLMRLQEQAKKTQEATELAQKRRRDMEEANNKLLAEKNALLNSLSGEQNALQDYQAKCAQLTAQKEELDNQLRQNKQKIALEELARQKMQLEKNSLVTGFKKENAM